MSEKAGGKDVIYIDVDDEITGIIDKVRGSGSKIVALVLPKRATMLQSIVNMKLLKRSADESKKNLVLITSEIGLMPLAGNVGLYVAKTLQSKPEIPEAPDAGDARPEDITEDDIEDEPIIADTPAAVAAAAAAAANQKDKLVDRTLPVGELAGAAAMDDTIEMGDEDDASSDGGAATPGQPQKPKDKKLLVPNFNRFRLLMVLAGLGVILLGVVIFVCATVLPKASISIKTDSQAIDSSTVVTLKAGSTAAVDAAEATAPAKSQQVQKTVTEQTAATGQQNNGAKASGSVVMSAGPCSGTVPDTIAAGTGVTSSSVTFITQDSVVFGPVVSGGKCNFKSGSVDITAQSPGEKYNIPAGSFTVAGHPSVSAASSDPTSGGTDDITKIVTQADIDTATQKIAAQDSTASKTQLKTDLTNMGYMPIEVTFSTGTPQTKTSVNAGDKADSVTVTQTITYTMLGAKQDDLKKIIAEDISHDIDTKRQVVLDYGISGAVFGLQSQPADGAVLTMQATAVAGPELNATDIKKQVAGKKAGAVKDLIKQNPGVTDVTVNYSPFWVSSVPSKTSKITVTIEKPSKTVKSTNPSSSNATNP